MTRCLVNDEFIGEYLLASRLSPIAALAVWITDSIVQILGKFAAHSSRNCGKSECFGKRAIQSGLLMSRIGKRFGRSRAP
jgi:hypothetical protein